ncbi:Friend virus susceptibility protein 1-like [Syngnathoides biaculeatus]|uniref:Friend virus susceptibility protein 1-like n=1 Tax=Syngnathoides biaculeatus TaxID=300417 RepID=UPI002ADE4CF6|nr:Friend virus susceptibility protein 1-like [Syngnathoides biaculeatus]XP_061687564.1 Friend virus susceptibility protein 1-like [Syngnathoides biaculeatus]
MACCFKSKTVKEAEVASSFKCKTVKGAEVAPNEDGVSDWESLGFEEIGKLLRRYGGRPRLWIREIPLATPPLLQRMLSRVEVRDKAPLGGVREMLWIFAEAWKERTKALDKVCASEMQKDKKIAQLEENIKALESDQAKAQKILEKSVAFISSMAREKSNKRPRRIDPKQVRSFAVALQEDWEPEGWNGDIWGDGDMQYGGEMKPQPLYPQLGHLQVKPISRRREEQHVVLPVFEEQRDENNVPIVDREGNPIMRRLEQPQPPPRMTITKEDFSQEEIAHLTSKYRQKQGELADSWLRRMYEEGADAIELDSEDFSRFGGLSSDSRMNAEFRANGRAMAVGDSFSLFALYAMTAQSVYPTWHDRPEIKGPWVTSRDAIHRMGRLCTRESISRAGHAFIDEAAVLKVVRDAIIRDAPSHYRSAILTILLGAVDNSFSDVKTRLLELATLGDWGDTVHQPCPENYRSETDGKQPRAKPPEAGSSRREMWKALIVAGVPAEEIDGLPTSADMLVDTRGPSYVAAVRKGRAKPKSKGKKKDKRSRTFDLLS